MPTYYQVLGLTRGCKQEEIRSAYRKLVLAHHPDHSSDPKSKEIFIAVTEAYDVLSDPTKRKAYDHALAADEERKRPKTATPRPSTPPQSAKKPGAPRPGASVDIARLTSLYSRGRHVDAENLAHKIIASDSRQPLPYAILGDLARTKGRFGEAAKFYAYAVQMDPRNELYQHRHEEMIRAADRAIRRKTEKNVERNSAAIMSGAAGIVGLTGIYLIVSKEPPLFSSIALISSFTIGLVVMALISGIALGAGLSLAGNIDRFVSVSTTSVGRISPSVALGTVAIFNFWLAVGLYFVVATILNAQNYSTGRLLAGVAITVGFLSLCSYLSPSLNAVQTLIWSGNLIYIGALMGWMFIDSMKA
ncbi:MAG: DnaJ domain-containing protein [Armatimonadetes bacterium]|nr:DnaJ domain-containing protein [Armatimonadota bacterium]